MVGSKGPHIAGICRRNDSAAEANGGGDNDRIDS